MLLSLSNSYSNLKFLHENKKQYYLKQSMNQKTLILDCHAILEYNII